MMQLPNIDKFFYFFVNSLHRIIKYSEEYFFKKYQIWFNYYGRYHFLNRSKASKYLVIVVIGYKPFIWKYTLDRIIKYTPKNYDVCLCIPGNVNRKYYNKLIKVSYKYNWSILKTSENKLSLAQNLAIYRHPISKYIFKLDEDIFIGKNYYRNLLETYNQVIKEGFYSPSIVSPILNVNGYTYLHCLNHFTSSQKYLEIFGELKLQCYGSSIQKNPDAALFMWNLMKSFDSTVNSYQSTYKYKYNVCPNRFSIGAFLISRTTFDSLNGFSVACPAQLGLEEETLAHFAISNSKPIIVSEHTFAGHFSFGPQERLMKAKLNKLRRIFE